MYRSEDLISQTNELLASAIVKDVTDLAGDGPVEGSVDVDVSEDEMTAWITLFPPRGGADPITPDMVIARLVRAGVVFGIDHESLTEAVFACNTEHRTVYSVEVARGEAPQDAVPEHMQVVYTPETSVPDERGGRVDYHEWSTIPVVSAGTVLARMVPQTAGREGMTVTGEDVPFRSITPKETTAGEHTVIENDEIRAAVEGVFLWKDDVISISPLLEVTDDVDYGTGNIDFNGDILLHGRVAAGFTVHCTGTLRAVQTLDAFGITCGALEVKQGIIGHNNALVSVAGPVKVRFLQNVLLQSSETVAVGQSILASTVTADEKIRMGRGSTVIGSVLRASNGIDAYNIGSPGSAVTELYLGIDFEVDRRLAEIRDNTIALGKQLQKVKMAIERKPEDKDRLVQLSEKIKAAISILGQEAGDLINGLDRNENAEVIVRGTVYTGTYIEICHRSFHVDRELKACRIFLDRKLGSIKVEPLIARRT